MKFGTEHTGKEIRIHNTEGADWLKKGGVYKIQKVFKKEKVLLQGVDNLWTSVKEGSWTLESKPIENLVEGDEVILMKDTTSLKKGSRTKIAGFLNDDQRKMIVDGIIPGSWIRPEFVVKAIDLSKFRMKKAIELARDFSFDFAQVLELHSSLFVILGKNLNDLDLTQEYDRLTLLSPRNCWINSGMYTDQPYEPLDFRIMSKERIKPSTTATATVEIDALLGKLYSEVNKDFDPENDKQVMLFCKESMNREYLKIKQTIVMYDAFKIVKKKDNEQAQPNLPF